MGGKEAQTIRFCRGALRSGVGRGKATVGTAASSCGTELYTPPFLKGEETLCGLEGAPAAVPDASRGLQNSVYELDKDRKGVKRTGGQTGWWWVVARFARDRGSGGGRVEPGAGGGAGAARGRCGAAVRAVSPPPRSPRLCPPPIASAHE